MRESCKCDKKKRIRNKNKNVTVCIHPAVKTSLSIQCMCSKAILLENLGSACKAKVRLAK